MSADRRGSAGDPTGGPDLSFNPLAGGIGVFTAVATPVAGYGLSLTGQLHTLIPAAGLVLGLLTGLAAGLWLDRRDGRVWTGPQL